MTSNLKPLESSQPKPVNKPRILSIDALRGFDMFWILGAESLFAALFVISGWPIFSVFAEQMLHSQWHGITAYDLIFPLFIFLSGVSLGLAAKPLTQYSSEKSSEILRQGIKRLFLLILLGVLYNHGWGTGIPTSIEDIRFVSVLGRIGISWFVAALLVWYCSTKVQWYVAIGILLGYWCLLTFVSIGEYGGGDYSANGALNVWFDLHFLPGASYQDLAIDPEGVLSNLVSIVNALAGVFVGRLMKSHLEAPSLLLKKLFLVGISSLIFGYVWSLVFPLNKTLWTSSFALVTIGYSVLILALFYWLIDVLKFSLWAKFFAVIGTNSIIAYLATSLFDWKYLTQSFIGGAINSASPGWSELVLFSGMLILQWLFLCWLYKRKIFIKV